MDWIYLSPHLDDVALSCGGLVWEQAQSGLSVGIWTICAGDPPPGPLSAFAESLHERWQSGAEAMDLRRSEDSTACTILGASNRHFPIPDCIYRRVGPDNSPGYSSEESLFGPIHQGESALISKLSHTLSSTLPQRAIVVCPLTLGGHVDHVLTRKAAEETGRPLMYYEDYPYVEKDPDYFLNLRQAVWESQVFEVSEQAITAWQAAVAAHASQISTFWPNLDSMKAAICEKNNHDHGIRLWHTSQHKC
jgi:LmbE family N-acetylglucosaminyl deacetylase